MTKFIEGVHQVWYINVYENKVEVECKMYRDFMDCDWIETGVNCYHTREEAESAATEVRKVLKMAQKVEIE